MNIKPGEEPSGHSVHASKADDSVDSPLSRFESGRKRTASKIFKRPAKVAKQDASEEPARAPGELEKEISALKRKLKKSEAERDDLLDTLRVRDDTILAYETKMEELEDQIRKDGYGDGEDVGGIRCPYCVEDGAEFDRFDRGY